MSIAELASARSELGAVCAAMRAFATAANAGLLELLERVGASLDRDLAERASSKAAEADRLRAYRAKRTRTVHVRDESSLSLSLDLKDPREREERATEAYADKTSEIVATPPPCPSTSNTLAGGASEEPAISLVDPLTEELRKIALSADVADPQRCWLKFLGRNCGKRRPMPAAWFEWCARELPPRAQPPPSSETRIRAAPRNPEIERENDRAHAEYRRQAVPLPPDWRRALGAPLKCPIETAAIKAAV